MPPFGKSLINGIFSDLDSYKLTHELVVTLMVQVSEIVNSRLISTVPSDADQPQTLTPNMLLTMKTRPLVSPLGIFTSHDLFSRRHWRRAQYQFWSRCKNEYLQNRQIPLERIVDAVESSNDGLVRKAKIVSWRDGEKEILC